MLKQWVNNSPLPSRKSWLAIDLQGERCCVCFVLLEGVLPSYKSLLATDLLGEGY
jgi:hypothetical protein